MKVRICLVFAVSAIEHKHQQFIDRLGVAGLTNLAKTYDTSNTPSDSQIEATLHTPFSYYGIQHDPVLNTFIHDMIFRNGQTGMTQVGAGPHKGILYHNVEIGCDAWFYDDSLKRVTNDYKNMGVSMDPNKKHYFCPNGLTANGAKLKYLWLVNADVKNNRSVKIYATTLQRIVVIGANANELPLYTPKSKNAKICRYQHIEDAFADKNDSDGCGNFKTEEIPPFLNLSCSGWKNPPSNCTNKTGSFY